MAATADYWCALCSTVRRVRWTLFFIYFFFSSRHETFGLLQFDLMLVYSSLTTLHTLHSTHSRSFLFPLSPRSTEIYCLNFDTSVCELCVLCVHERRARCRMLRIPYAESVCVCVWTGEFESREFVFPFICHRIRTYHAMQHAHTTSDICRYLTATAAAAGGSTEKSI